MTELPPFIGGKAYMVDLLYGATIILRAIMIRYHSILHMLKHVILLMVGSKGEMKVKKILTCLTLILLSASTFAMTVEEKAAQEQENMKILASMGLPLPGSGIKLVPRSMLNLSAEEIEKGKKEEAEFKEKGYVNTYTNRPRELLNLKTLINKKLKLSEKNTTDTSTDLRKSIQDIKLAFSFPGTSKQKSLRSVSSDITVLAAAPKGGFHDDKGG